MEPTRSLIRILRQDLEEPCQQFLTRYDFVLKSLFGCDACKPKFRLGNSYVTDFLLTQTGLTHGERLVLVEIEPPTSRPFTRSGRYSERLNSALNQINDWLAWTEKERGFFRRSLPTQLRNFHSTKIEAAVIIGRRSHLTEADDERRGAVRLMSSHKIQILHYDNVLEEYDRQYGIWLIRTGRASPADLLKLGCSKNDQVRALVAEHPDASPALLEKLVRDECPKVTNAVASNPRAQRRTIILLAKEGSKTAFNNLLADRGLDPETSLEIVRDGNKAAKKIILENETWPSELLKEAVKGRDPEFRVMALELEGAPVAVLSQASKCRDLGTKMAVIMHSQCPTETRQRLVVELATKSWWSGEACRLELFLSAFGAQLEFDFWEELANSKDAAIRSVVVSQASIPRPIFQRLRNDKSPVVREKAKYESRSLSEAEILTSIAQETSDWERSRLVEHPSVSSAEALKSFAADDDTKIRIGVLNNPNVTQEILLALSVDPATVVRTKATGILDARARKNAG